MKNPFKKMQFIDKEKFLNEVFSAASRAVEKEVFELSDKAKMRKKRISIAVEIAKQKEGLRIKTCGTLAAAKLKALSTSLPNTDKLPEIYKELVLIFASERDIEKMASDFQWSSKKIEGIKFIFLDRLKHCATTHQARRIRQEFFGRVADYIRKCSRQLELFSYLYRNLRNLPDLKDEKTIAIAGLPNVGKTSLLKAITGSDPEIQPYPFTTKGLMVGYADFGFEEIQFIDMPGLLDRPMQKRNEIELQSIAVLKTISDFVIYIFDLSETCGFTIDQQKNLFEEIKKIFKKPMLAVANKIDIVGGKTLEELGVAAMKVSCETSEGVDALRKKIKTCFYD